MKKHIQLLIAIIILAVFTYLRTAYYNSTFDLTKFSDESKGIGISIYVIIIFIATSIIYNIDLPDKPKQE